MRGTCLAFALTMAWITASLPAATLDSNVEDVRFVADCDGSTQRYIVALPEQFDKSKAHDILIALHGHGSDRWQFVKSSRAECRSARDVAAEHHMIFVSPDYRAKTSWMGPKAEADVVQIITRLKETYRVSRIFICGASMGGTACLTFAALHPDLVDGVASMNGTANLLEYENFQAAIQESFGGTKSEIPQEYKRRSAEYWPEKLTMPVGITAGGKDTSVPPQSVLRLSKSLEALDRDVLVIYREQGGHSTNYADGLEIMRFMIRKATPSKTNSIKDGSKIAPAVIFDPGPYYSDGVRMFQGIPGLERSPRGRLWVTWYGGGVTEDRFNYIMLITSGDDGVTWSGLKTVIDPDVDGPCRAFDPCPWIDPNGRLWLFWSQRDRDVHLWAMTTGNPDDENPTWSPPRLICRGIMMCKPTVLSTGEWLLPVALWKEKGSSTVVSSTDRGKTWKTIGSAGIPNEKDRNCDEHMIVERADGSLWLLVRTRYGLGESVSTDRGRTWSDVVQSQIAHTVARFFIRRLNSGKLLLIKHGPINERTDRSRLTAFVSGDDGRSWQGGLMLDARPGVSYPDGVQSPDGTIYIVYDYSRTGAKQILTAIFTEEDVIQGRCVSEKARLQILANRATGMRPASSPKFDLE